MSALATTPATMTRARWDGWRFLYVATLALTILASSQFITAATIAYYPRFAAAALLGIWSWRVPDHGDRTRLRDLPRVTRRLLAGLWLMVVAATASALLSFSFVMTIEQTAALVVLVAIMHGTVTGRWATSRELVRADLSAAFWVCVIAATVGVVGARIGAYSKILISPDDRLQGVFNNANLLSLVAVAALAIGLALYADTHRTRYLIGCAPLAVSLIEAESRTALIALLVGAAWTLPRLGQRFLLLASYVLALVATVIFLLNWQAFTGLRNSTLVERLSTVDISLGGRTVAWSEAIQIWTLQPFVGHGYGAGPDLFDQLYESGRIASPLGVTHNSYLQWLLETGLVGVGPMLVVLIALLTLGFARQTSRLGLWLTVVPIAGLATGVTESALLGTGQPYPYLFWLTVGAVAALHNHSIADVSPAPAEGSRRPRVGALR